MPRRSITFAKGNYYHIYNRGAGRLPIFRQTRNYHFLLQLLADVASECNATILAYCLLPNHYHWFARQDGDTPLRELPKRVFGSYSQVFNRAYHRTGTLFEGLYHATLVDSESYLLHLCRYIHGNPVKHGLALSPGDWPYSNYLEWVGLRRSTPFDQQFVQQYFPNPTLYRRFVQEFIDLQEAPDSYSVIQSKRQPPR